MEQLGNNEFNSFVCYNQLAINAKLKSFSELRAYFEHEATEELENYCRIRQFLLEEGKALLIQP